MLAVGRGPWVAIVNTLLFISVDFLSRMPAVCPSSGQTLFRDCWWLLGCVCFDRDMAPGVCVYFGKLWESEDEEAEGGSGS